MSADLHLNLCPIMAGWVGPTGTVSPAVAAPDPCLTPAVVVIMCLDCMEWNLPKNWFVVDCELTTLFPDSLTEEWLQLSY